MGVPELRLETSSTPRAALSRRTRAGNSYRESEPVLDRPMDARTEWHPRQGRQATEAGIPDVDQCAASKDPKRSSSKPAKRRASR